MEFEFDTKKSEVNKKKHGINFIEAQALWEDIVDDVKQDVYPSKGIIAVQNILLGTKIYQVQIVIESDNNKFLRVVE